MSDRPANRLGRETSPYLLQHAHNPVDWYPWGDEAHRAARTLDRPLFLSVGYSSCHWCHVMEHESFENEATAALMNKLFINVKVDREERPDLDEIYMQAVQLFTGGHGGWPMSVFLTPDLEPFLGGTYFPPEDRHGMPGFRTLLEFAARVYRDRRDDVAQTAAQVVTALRDMTALEAADTMPDQSVLQAAYEALLQSFDTRDGGFGSAPKFPHAMGLSFLLRWHARSNAVEALDMVRHTLRRMARGGMRDQLGGGFHRYSVDAQWLVPHFEKMLYDNALLTRTYTEGWQACREPEFRNVALEILADVARTLTSPEGAFYSALDADSEGVEGRYFVWTRSEINAAVGVEAAAVVCAYYDVTERGNFEHGTSILAVPRDVDVVAAELGSTAEAVLQQISAARTRLLEVRGSRIAPQRDDKIIVAWNGLMITACARAYQAWGDPQHLRQARAAARFILDRCDADAGVFRTAKDGVASGSGFLDDHAGFLAALLDLYESDFEPQWIEAALRLEAHIAATFWDESEGGYFYTGRQHETLLARTRQPFDNATPSGNALMAASLLRISAFTGDAAVRARAERVLQLFTAAMRRYPSGMAEMLCALDWALGPVVQVAIAGHDERARNLARAVRQPFAPRKVVAGWPDAHPPAALPLLADRHPVGDRAAGFVCRDFTCLLPETDSERLAQAVVEASRAVAP